MHNSTPCAKPPTSRTGQCRTTFQTKRTSMPNAVRRRRRFAGCPARWRAGALLRRTCSAALGSPLRRGYRVSDSVTVTASSGRPLQQLRQLGRSSPRSASLSPQCKNVKPTPMRPTIRAAIAAKKVQRTKWYIFSSRSRRSSASSPNQRNAACLFGSSAMPTLLLSASRSCFSPVRLNSSRIP
jgi:hypothetical protein